MPSKSIGWGNLILKSEGIGSQIQTNKNTG